MALFDFFMAILDSSSHTIIRFFNQIKLFSLQTDCNIMLYSPCTIQPKYYEKGGILSIGREFSFFQMPRLSSYFCTLSVCSRKLL